MTIKRKPVKKAEIKEVSKESGLVKLIKYIISQDSKRVMKLIYESGFLPYDHKEPVDDYLLRHTIAIAHEEGDEGIKKLMNIHPDKNLILNLFSSSYKRETEDPLEDDDESNFFGDEHISSSRSLLNEHLPLKSPAITPLGFLGLLGICFFLFYLAR